MANVTTYNTSGLFTANKAMMQLLSSSSKTVSLIADLKGAKATATVLLFLPLAASGTHTLTFKSANGGRDIVVPLNVGFTNVIPISTEEIKKEDGTAELVFTTTATNVSGLSASICVFTHSPVVNH